jgi:hypothetical protein
MATTCKYLVCITFDLTLKIPILIPQIIRQVFGCDKNDLNFRPTLDERVVEGPISKEPIWTDLKQIESLSWNNDT